MECSSETLDLSGQKLKKLCKPTPIETQATTLILDDNDLQRLDNIDSFTKVQKLSAVRNQLLRMHGVCRLYALHTLNLANNGILTIEGLKDLVNLKCLNLAGNNIKTIQHLNTNINLEHLDLSENSITHIMDLSFLKNLKELLLHNNKIGHLRQCDRFLPTSLLTLTLASNNLSDLNEISQLVNLTNLKSISLMNNPCVIMTGNKIRFDYRPFVINWCMNVNVIDGYVVDAIESLRGEWLYSQGRGRHYRIGNQEELSQYLATVCPLSGEQLETEEDRKLRLILSKAQHHQQQLREQLETPTPSPLLKKKLHNPRHSPRINSSRLSNKSKSPDRMSASYYNSSNVIDSSCLMTQSLDPNLLGQSVGSKNFIEKDAKNEFEQCLNDTEVVNSPLQALSKLVPVPESLMSPDYRPSPLVGRISTPSTIPTPMINRTNSVKLTQPVKSPKFSRINMAKSMYNTIENKKNIPSPVRQRRIIQNNSNDAQKQEPNAHPTTKPLQSALKKSSSTEDESEICDAKLQTIQMKAEKRRHQEEMSSNESSEDKIEQAAIYIQKMWRGYYTRNRDKYVQQAYKILQARRADEYIQKLAVDMESTKAALESERKIQMLQMQAINALWKKVSTIQPEAGESQQFAKNTASSIDNTEIDKDLAQTCNVLQNQIQQLQGSMQDIVKFISMFSHIGVSQQIKENGTATQTEIVAVHTPQGDAAKMFPFMKQTRPSSLPLPVSQKSKKDNSNIHQELRQFAGSLVDDVIKTVSETNADCVGFQTTEVTITDTDKYDSAIKDSLDT